MRLKAESPIICCPIWLDSRIRSEGDLQGVDHMNGFIWEILLKTPFQEHRSYKVRMSPAFYNPQSGLLRNLPWCRRFSLHIPCSQIRSTISSERRFHHILPAHLWVCVWSLSSCLLKSEFENVFIWEFKQSEALLIIKWSNLLKRKSVYGNTK